MRDGWQEIGIPLPDERDVKGAAIEGNDNLVLPEFLCQRTIVQIDAPDHGLGVHAIKKPHYRDVILHAHARGLDVKKDRLLPEEAVQAPGLRLRHHAGKIGGIHAIEGLPRLPELPVVMPFPRRGDAPHSLRTEKRIPVGDALPPHALLRLPADAVKEDEGFGDHREERKRTV